MSMLFAATYPDRTRALALFGSAATNSMRGSRQWSAIGVLATPCASGSRAKRTTKPFAGNLRAAARRWRFALSQMNHDVDIRDILPAIRVPTLLLHRVGMSFHIGVLFSPPAVQNYRERNHRACGTLTFIIG